MYKLTNNNVIIRTIDGANIPIATGNKDYQEYLEWVAQGNVPIPRVTLGELRQELIQQVKDDAYQIIISRYPTWKQSNMLARWLELQRIASPTIADQAEIDSYLAIWNWIKGIRSQSNVFEQEITDSVDPATYTYNYITT